MRSTFKVLFYLKKNAPKKNGSVPVMCRITIDGTNPTYFNIASRFFLMDTWLTGFRMLTSFPPLILLLRLQTNVFCAGCRCRFIHKTTCAY